MSEATISSYVSERSSPRSGQGEGGDDITSPNSRKSQKGTVTAISGDFIKNTGPSSGEFHIHKIDKLRSMVKRWTSNQWITQVMGLVILFDAYCNCTDIDARAQGPGHRPAEFFQVGGAVCLVLYTVESCLVLFGQGWIVLTDRVFLIDLCVIVCGYLEMILDALSDQSISASFGILRLLRLARVMRLLRLLRKTRALRELQKLVIMMSTCMKALIWSFIFCFVIMTIWAMLMVEIVYPLIQELHREDPNIFGDCEQCLWATSSVMGANLLLFKTVIAGDSWGTIAVPVIEHHPATAIIFMGSLLTLVFGVLNLIVAVVVDTFADARDRDILNLAEEMEADMEADKRLLTRIFNRIDVDNSGQLSLAQLVDGARKDAEFQSRLRVMDIDEMDLAQLFDMIDTDGSGFIEPNEFIRPLSRWVHDSKTAPRFIKYNLMRTMQQQEEIKADQTDLKRSMETNFSALSERMELIQSPNSSPYLLKEDKRVSFKDACVDHASTGPMETVISMKREEGLVQPHPSKKVTTLVQKIQDSEANLKDAMERLEELVLHATESALRESTDMIGHILLEKLKESNLRQELDLVLPATSLVTSPAPDPMPTAIENLATAILGRPPEVSMNSENGREAHESAKF